VHRQHTPRTVLFDLDDTLFDHQFAARSALQLVHATYVSRGGARFDVFERLHAGFLEELHEQVMNGAMALDDARVERFRRLFAAAGVDADADLLRGVAAAYRAEYLRVRRPVPGARALVTALKSRVMIGIVSNNLLEEQQQKVTDCGLDDCVDALVVSEEAGVSKPDPAIFQIALERLGCRSDEAVMIGDSWTADIEGARRAGIRPIWFNRTGRPASEPLGDVTEIVALEPLQLVLDVVLGDPS
jgi:YjjG family noncanonical pyrimidine nucleotidase